MTTPQEVFPEIRAATNAVEKRIAITESELVEIKESIDSYIPCVKRWLSQVQFHARSRRSAWYPALRDRNWSSSFAHTP